MYRNKKYTLKKFLFVILPIMFTDDKITISIFDSEGKFYNYKVGDLDSKCKITKLDKFLKYKVIRIYEENNGLEIVIKKEA